jgi:kynurenine formamidase
MTRHALGVWLLAIGLVGGLAVSAWSRPTSVSAAEATPDVAAPDRSTLWRAYYSAFARAKHIDLTHTIDPAIPVWRGFGPSAFGPSINPETGRPYGYETDGFEATRYDLATDQLGTQLDPPAHWDPNYPAIDELPPTYAVRPLVVISIVQQVAEDPNYALQVRDIAAWERVHGRVPAGSVVFVRSDWSKRWPDRALAREDEFPGVSLAALKFLHLSRHILLHGHEPLDTDSTPTLEGEAWLMHNGYAQAEGVANLDLVAETGCVVSMGYPKFRGGTGGYARYVAICPPSWQHGVTIAGTPEAPLPYSDAPLHWDLALGTRVR